MENIYNIFKKLTPYIIVIFITIYIYGFIVKTSNNTTFVNNFNFASTITSIILSVIAIIYTLIDSADSKTIQTKIIDASEDIKKSTKDLKIVSENMKNIEKRIDTLENSIKESNKELVSSIMGNNKEKSKVDYSKSISAEINNIISNFSAFNLMSSLLFYITFKNKTNLDLRSYNDAYNKRALQVRFPQENIIQPLLLTLDFLSSFGFIKFSIFDSYEVNISSFDDKFEKALLDRVPEKNQYHNLTDEFLFRTVYEFFDK